ncbi:MAG: hypothetical protein LBS43_09110 [Prevotellaceae bacterium]|jgi:hypothetical protein|nr:hypothetical protein [Prevotellaceae bacterium]
MKKIFWLLAAFFIVSCSIDENNETIYQSYGVVKEDSNTSGKLYVRSDEGKIIVPSLSNLLSNDDRDSRIWMLFSTNDNVDSDTIKANVYDFLRITEIAFKNQSDESTSNEVYLQEKNVWIAQDYLTMIMDVTANSEISLKNHKYTMYSDLEIVNDTVRMEFKYDRNNDSNNITFNKIVAMKLSDKIAVTDSQPVVLAIKYLTHTGYKEIFVTYKQ